MKIRPIEARDLDTLVSMAEESGTGVTTLPVNTQLLAEKIKASEQSFAKQVPPDEARYLFALEDIETGKTVGVSGIEAAVGLDQVWYNYRLSTSVSMSNELDIRKQTPTLFLTNDLTGATEVCTLFLMPEYRKGNNGLQLSLCRFLFMAVFSAYFNNKVFAEMRGVSDEDGRSPFWEALGEKFFKLDFSHADYLTGIGNKSFIAELMPKYPIYVPMLTDSAQKVIAEVHPDTRPARAMLEREGFNFNGFIDIFDGGPALEAFQQNIRVIRQCESASVKIISGEESDPLLDNSVEQTDWYLLANSEFESFSCILVDKSRISNDNLGAFSISAATTTVRLEKSEADAIDVKAGARVYIAPLRDNVKKGTKDGRQ